MNIEDIDLRGILIESVSVQSGGYQDGRFVVGEGVTRFFDEPLLGDEYATERVEDLLDRVGVEGLTDKRVVYNLKVRASIRSTASAKARAFTRAKHPSKVGVISVEVEGEDSSMSEDGLLKWFDVTTMVRV